MNDTLAASLPDAGDANHDNHAQGLTLTGSRHSEHPEPADTNGSPDYRCHRRCSRRLRRLICRSTALTRFWSGTGLLAPYRRFFLYVLLFIQLGRRASLPTKWVPSARCASAAWSSGNVRATWTSKGPESIRWLSLAIASWLRSPL
jgi:hypothetical protein